MKRPNTKIVACCLALAGSLLTALARADESNRKTVITFSQPFEIPKIHAESGVLPAGTYVFKILDSRSNHHIVQILGKEERIVFATILAIPNYRLQATSKTVISFSERANGQPEALRAWFYPGANWGEEFVYPMPRAVELAKSAQAPVLSLPPELPVVEELKRAPVVAIQPTGEEVSPPAVISPAPPPKVRIAVRQPPANLAAVSIIGLAGLLGLGSAIALSLIRKRFMLMESRLRWAQYCQKFL